MTLTEIPDSIPQQVGAIGHYVADINADTEHDPPILRHAGIALRHRLLYRQRATYCVDDAGKLKQQAVSCGIGDATAMGGQSRADDVGSDDGRQSALRALGHDRSVAQAKGNRNRHHIRVPGLVSALRLLAKG